MKCEMCRDQEALVHVTQVVDGKVKKLHLCEACAVKSGLDVGNPAALTDILLGVGLQKPAPGKPPAPAPDRTCQHCQMRLSDFRKTSRLGCPVCYDSFAGELELMLESMHRGTQHVGKVPVRADGSCRKQAEQAGLRKALAAAVAAENYEEAARVRDLIRLSCGGAGPQPTRPKT
ncbi:MAG: excinuclease ABC subunit B [Lentisphaerae bacterium]|nr:excinuclease ABC subunit B [Lentisphaerota bacterium]